MFKKLFSKRTGFTLVEIVIAFAIMVIMFAMITQILSLSTSRRRANMEFANELAEDELALVTNGRVNSYDNAAGDDGNLVVKFDDGSELSWKYQLKDAEGNAGSAEGVNYIVGELDYTANGNDTTSSDSTSSSNPNNNVTGTQASRLDTRILGTKGFNYIQVDSVTKTDPGTGVSSRYTFEVTADGSTVAANDKKYTQFAMLFFTNDGKPAYATNIQRQSGYTCYPSGVNGVKITVVHSSANSWEQPNNGMQDSLRTKFTVDFTDATGNPIDPEITTASFGANATPAGAASQYTMYTYDVTDDSGNTTTYGTPNIYGAYPKS